MTDRAAFIAAVKADPSDDAPRLIYADWLEERVSYVPCPDCNGEGFFGGVRMESLTTYTRDCPRCTKTGRVSNGFAERAKLIRVQIELAKLNDPVAWEECKHPGRECKNPACPLVAQHARYKEARKLERELADLFGSEDSSVTLTWVRGFVEEFTGSAEKWLEYGDPLITFHPVREVKLTTTFDDPWSIFPPGFVWDPLALPPTTLLDMVEVRWPGITFHLPLTSLVNADWDTRPNATPLTDLRALTERMRPVSSPITAAGTAGSSTAPTG